MQSLHATASIFRHFPSLCWRARPPSLTTNPLPHPPHAPSHAVTPTPAVEPGTVRCLLSSVTLEWAGVPLPLPLHGPPLAPVLHRPPSSNRPRSLTSWWQTSLGWMCWPDLPLHPHTCGGTLMGRTCKCHRTSNRGGVMGPLLPPLRLYLAAQPRCVWE